jgi:hypothetical protein
MLQKLGEYTANALERAELGEHIANALERAAAADQRAKDATEGHFVTARHVRIDNTRTAQSWRTLARILQFAESIRQFLLDALKRGNARPSEPPKKHP